MKHLLFFIVLQKMTRNLLQFFIELQENEYTTPLSVEFGGELDITVKYKNKNKEPVKYCNMYYHTYQYYTSQSFLEFRSIGGESLKVYFELMSSNDGDTVYEYVCCDIDEILFELSASPPFKNALSNDDV
jgi:hypothetical protein